MDNTDARTCIKVMIIVTCTFYILGGLGYLGSGADMVTKSSDDVEPNSLEKSAGIGAIIGGFIMIIVGIVGCCGSIMNNKPLLIIFASLMIVDAVIMLGLGITAIIFSTKTDDQERFQSNKKSTKDSSILTMGIICLLLAIYSIFLGIMVIYLAKIVRPGTQYYTYAYPRQPMPIYN
ncbi:unnamed protein product [Ceutorhynchus assimilis]|uniref:Uncharacterized protein n=1 Tax=Ceutorhynchus assimilis TaxID=467358 RepID=A0A9N9MK94_9CUCU|nr:unnamed protein product [Ceutorhynchus assimilis]